MITVLPAGQNLDRSDDSNGETRWFLSTPDVPNLPVGTEIFPGRALPIRSGFNLPYRLVGFPSLAGSIVESINSSSLYDIDAVEDFEDYDAVSLDQLGIIEGDSLQDDVKYPILRGRGVLDESLAVCEMIALVQRVPFRRDAIKKF